VDFAGGKLHVLDETTGELKPVEVFVSVLGCSQLLFVIAVASQRTPDFVDACRCTLEYYGGVPTAIVPDNLKAAVIRSSKHESLVNETFAAFAEHYNTAVLPARPYKPKDKSLVEGAESWFISVSTMRLRARYSAAWMS